MQKFVSYIAFFAGVPLFSALVTQSLSARGVSRGATRFAASTIGVLAIYVYWVHLRNL